MTTITHRVEHIAWEADWAYPAILIDLTRANRTATIQYEPGRPDPITITDTRETHAHLADTTAATDIATDTDLLLWLLGAPEREVPTEDLNTATIALGDACAAGEQQMRNRIATAFAGL